MSFFFRIAKFEDFRNEDNWRNVDSLNGEFLVYINYVATDTYHISMHSDKIFLHETAMFAWCLLPLEAEYPRIVVRQTGIGEEDSVHTHTYTFKHRHMYERFLAYMGRLCPKLPED